MRIHERRSLGRRLRPYFTVFDGPLTLIIVALLTVSMITLYSASIGIPGKMEDQVRNILLSFLVMWVAANISPQTMMRIAVPAYAAGMILLVGVALFGIIKLGARRWLHVGIDIQPSEFMKIVTPMMLAWFFQQRAGQLRWHSYLLAAVLLMAPVLFIVRQPDLGTALLVVAAGFTVIFLAGLAWKAIGVLLLVAVALFGTIKLGARRWLHVGIDIQPSEFMKIVTPMMLAWFFQHRAGQLRWQAYCIAALLLICLLYTSPSPRDRQKSRMPSSA